MVNSGKVPVCIKISGVPDSEGQVFTPESLMQAAAKDPDNLWTKTRPDGRVELWANVHPVASPLSSKEE